MDVVKRQDKVILVGNLGNDPETILRWIESGNFIPADVVNDPSRAACSRRLAAPAR